MTPTKIPVSRDWDLASCEISAITDPAYNTKPSPLHTTKLPLPAPKRFPQVTLFELSRAPNRDDIASFFGYKVEVERSTSRYPSPLYGVTTTMVSAEQAASTRATVYRSFADFRLLHSALFRVFPGILLPPPPTADNQSTLDTFIFSVLTSSRSNHLRTFQSPDALISSPPVESFLYEAEKRFAESLRLHYASDRKQAAKVAAALNKPPKSSRDTMNGLTLLADMIPSCISPNLQHFLAACTAPSAGEGHIKRDSSGTSGMLQSLGSTLLASRSTLHPPPPSSSSPLLSSQPPFSPDNHAQNACLLVSLNNCAAVSESLKKALTVSLLLEKERSERWKLFAVSLAALANLERRWDKAALSFDKRSPLPRTDVEYVTVEQALYLLARAKSDAYVPALEGVKRTLSELEGDLAMIPPSEEFYGKLKRAVEKEERRSAVPLDTPSQVNASLRSQLQAAKAKYDSAGHRLSVGLTDLAEHSQITFGRVACAFLTIEADSARSSRNVAAGVTSKLTTSSVANVPRETPPPVEKDDRREVEVLREMLALGANAMSEAAHAYLDMPYQQRFLDANAQLFTHLVLDDDNGAAKLSKQFVLDYLGSDKGLSADIVEYRKYASSLRENALRCVEAVGMLAQPVAVNGVKLDSDATRVHCLNSLFAFLQEGGVANGSDFHIAEDDLLFRCGAERLLLAEALAALGKFMGLLDGIMSFVNCERVAISVERECELRRNDTARILDSKNDLFLLISAATKKKDKMTVQKLKQVLADVDDGTTIAHVKAAKEKHRKSRDLRARLQKLGKKRLLAHQAQRQQVRIADIVKEWAANEMKHCPRTYKAAEKALASVRAKCAE